jgi:hypothetical protein
MIGRSRTASCVCTAMTRTAGSAGRSRSGRNISGAVMDPWSSPRTHYGESVVPAARTVGATVWGEHCAGKTGTLDYLDPAVVDVDALRADRETLVILHAGEEPYRLR